MRTQIWDNLRLIEKLTVFQMIDDKHIDKGKPVRAEARRFLISLRDERSAEDRECGQRTPPSVDTFASANGTDSFAPQGGRSSSFASASDDADDTFGIFADTSCAADPVASAASGHDGSVPAEAKSQAEVHKAHGNDHFKAGRWAEAADNYKLAMESDRTNAIYPSNRAAALLKLGKISDALANAQAALRLDSASSKAHIRASTALRQLGRFADARWHLDEARLAVTVDLSAVESGLAELNEMEELQCTGKAALEAAQARHDRDAACEAESTLTKLAKKCPVSVDVACLRMEAMLKARPAECVEFVLGESLRWLSTNSNHPDLLVVRGRAFYVSNRLDEVRAPASGSEREEL